MKRKIEKTEKPEFLPHIDSRCENCLWYLGNKECPAFREKIPEEIWNGLHDKVLKDQEQNLVFEENGPLI